MTEITKPLSTAPVSALWLGFGGLVPFAAAAATPIFAGSIWDDFATRALLAYGACILSFLGGVRWGIAITQRDARLSVELTTSVLPALVAWTALLVSPKAGLAMLAASFVVLLAADLNLPDVPPWYRALRIPLTAGAVIALLAGLFR